MTLDDVILRVRRAINETLSPSEKEIEPYSDAGAFFSPCTQFSDDRVVAAIIGAQRLIQRVAIAMVQTDAIEGYNGSFPEMPSYTVRILESRVMRNGVRCARRDWEKVGQIIQSGRPATEDAPVYSYSGGYLRVYPEGGTVICTIVREQTELSATTGSRTLVVGDQVREALVQLAAARLRAASGQTMLARMNIQTFIEEIQPYLRDGIQTEWLEREVKVERYQE